MTTQAERSKLHELMTLLYVQRALVNYPSHDIRGAKDAATWRLTTEAQLRTRLKNGGHIMFDCSQAVTQLCRWAGLADPSGWAYREPGYTGSILKYLRHYSGPASAYVGALVVYGPGTGDHVSMVYERGKDPLLWSHGFDAAPELIRLSKQRAHHRLPVTLCSIAKL